MEDNNNNNVDENDRQNTDGRGKISNVNDFINSLYTFTSNDWSQLTPIQQQTAISNVLNLGINTFMCHIAILPSLP